MAVARSIGRFVMLNRAVKPFFESLPALSATGPGDADHWHAMPGSQFCQHSRSLAKLGLKVDLALRR